MAAVRYSPEEIVRRGREIYAQSIRDKVEAANYGKYLSVDIESGDYALADDPLEAGDALRARRPDAVMFGMRVGYAAFGRLSGALRGAGRA